MFFCLNLDPSAFILARKKEGAAPKPFTAAPSLTFFLQTGREGMQLKESELMHSWTASHFELFVKGKVIFTRPCRYLDYAPK